jgi:hypothetical protein
MKLMQIYIRETDMTDIIPGDYSNFPLQRSKETIRKTLTSIPFTFHN